MRKLLQLNSNINYSLEVSSENTVNNIANLKLSHKHNFLLIQYGKKNTLQSYGGNTTLISCDEVKPCFVPVYLNSITPIGMLYFSYNVQYNEFNSYVVSNASNSTYLIRIIGIGVY